MRNKINKVVVLPRRDWRFWAALCAFGGILVVAAAFWAHLQTVHLSADNDRLVAQVDTQSAQQECRSRAAVFTEDVDIQADSLLARSLVAAVSDVDIEPYRKALVVANDNRDTAIAARAAAIWICSEDPTYVINPNILEPIPSLPQEIHP